MLKVTLHSAKPSSVSARNLVGRLDIGYATLDAIADYKGAMVTAGLGEQEPVVLKGYPRWSASLWDLVVRMTCLCINRQERVWPAEIPNARAGAFIDDLTARVEHWPDGFDVRRATVGTCHIAMRGTRCNYDATFTDDILGTSKSAVFRHTPAVLTHWDLLTRAYAWTTTETFVLPPRPELYIPIPIEHEEQSFVSLDTVSEPARTGCYRWLAKRGIDTVELPVVEGPCIPEKQFVEFLRRAI